MTHAHENTEDTIMIIAAEATEDEDPTPVRLKPDHSRYENRPGVTASGRSPYDIGDATAEIFRNQTLEQQYETVAEALAKEDKKTTKAEQLAALIRKYEGKNPGMQRMNLGNKYRGFLAREAKRAAA